MIIEHTDIERTNGEENEKKTPIEKIMDYLNLRYVFRRNVLTSNIECKEIDQVEYRILDDSILNSIWVKMQVDGFKYSPTFIGRILNSDFIADYNPITAYFESLPMLSDDKDYISMLADTITVQDIKVNDVALRKLWKPYFKKWLVASVATCLGLGINHTCLILVGNQGSGKTTWLNKLCPAEMKKYLVCSHINPSLTDQTTANYLAEKWFVNIDDQLETIFGKDFNSMKAIITAPSVTNRKTWHKFSKTRPRVCSFMGSVNEPKFLTDTENRRYLVFSAEKINYTHEVDMNKVWAQALQLVKENYPYWFSSEEMKQLNKANQVYRQQSIEEEYLIRMFKPCKPDNPKARFLMPSELLTLLNAHSGMRLSLKKLSRAMKVCGYGEPISKRLKDIGARKVYPVLEISESEQNNIQQEYRNDFKLDNK
ncbi:VapE domain-containing protein [Kordia algicida OT-1]|uniref:Virulence-associated protein E-like domain-containing protein n=1 Tax=Kordia algicida OT-1 TaxID=391587 RepID=A9DT08_9FLAO|nr:VapE domain-containing protein [Kordia algicida]EDP97008.1 hypothetical protein KAOT1_17633 [Kordia algicida OT-1]